MTLVCNVDKVYDSLALTLGIFIAECLTHVRRKFWHAEKFANKKATQDIKIRAIKALNYFRKIFKIEIGLNDNPPDEVLKVMQQ